MPPSRTLSAPASERQQCLKSTISRLCALVKLNSLQGYAEAVLWAGHISSKTAVAFACTAADGQDVGSYNKLLEALYSAISNGQKHLALSWPESSTAAAHNCYDPTLLDAAVTVGCLCRVASSCKCLEWYKQEYRGKEVDSAIKAGFLQQFSSLSTKLIPALQGTAAQHAASRQLGPCRLVATYLLELWCCMFQFWPGCKLTDSLLTATLAPAASLAFSLMCTIPVDMTPASSINSSSARVSETQLHATMHGDRRLWIDSCHASVCLAHSLLCVVHKECGVAQNSSNVTTSPRSNAAAALASPDVQRLLLFGLAAAAAVMHRQQAAVSKPPPASAADRGPDSLEQGQRQQHAEYGYMQLLVELGLEEADELIEFAVNQGGPAINEALKSPAFHHCMFAVLMDLYNRFCHQQQQDGSSSYNSSNPATSFLIEGEVRALPWQLALPVLHTLKDLTVLLPDEDVAGINRLIWVIGSVSQAAMEPSGQPKLSPGELQQILQWLLQPLYHKMRKALRTISQQQQVTNNPASADAECELTQTWAIAVQMFLTLGESSLHDYLSEAIKQDPVPILAAMEAVARVGGACINSKQGLLVHPAFHVAMSVITALVCDGDATNMLAPLAVQQQLLSLILCQKKLLMLVSAAPQTINAGDADTPAFDIHFADQQNIARVFELLKAVDHQSTDGQRPQINEVTEALHCAWLAVVGKAMYASAVSLLNYMPGQHLMVLMSTQTWVSLAQEGLSLVLLAGDHGKAALAAAKVDEILKQLSESFRTILSDGTAFVDGEESSRAVLHQLQQCGSAICAALPVKFCCNNPACLNLAKLSEQQLVAGKGSRCSGCKVARYCSRECQLKHWKQHKQACKRIQAEAAVGEGCS